jgi:hypothetical protein
VVVDGKTELRVGRLVLSAKPVDQQTACQLRRARASSGAVHDFLTNDERLDGQRLAVESAEFDADRAHRQFDACEPEHRLVARTFEGALAAVERERGKLAALEQARPAPLTDDERTALTRLARDLPRLWNAPTTTDRDRKELLRTLVATS